MRMFSVDSYLQKPIDGIDCVKSDITSKKIGRVPVIRIFGSTPSGTNIFVLDHKVCQVKEKIKSYRL